MFCSIIFNVLSIVKEIPVPHKEAARIFTSLHWEYNKTFLTIKAIVRDNVPLEKLTERIGTQCRDLEDFIRSATTTDEVMQRFWEKSCNFPYLYELDALVDTLSLPEAVKVIEQYEWKQGEVYRKISAQSFAKLAVKAYDCDNNVKVMCTHFQIKEFGSHYLVSTIFLPLFSCKA